MYKEFLETDQRPFPIRNNRWVMTQVWKQLLFCHWPVPADLLKEYIPPQLELDVFDGQAWLGIIPFQVEDMRLRGLPQLPYLSTYLELNVRTYVTYKGTPGIYFFNLDANKWMDVLGARIFAFLPYRKASMKMEVKGQHTCFQSNYNQNELLDIVYHPVSEPILPSKSSLEFWLFERYCFYTPMGKSIFRGDIHHDRWRVRKAEAEVRKNTIVPFIPETYKERPPLLHFSDKKQVFVWMLKQVK